MTIDFLLIGQGISGTLLHWYLSKANFNCVVIDNNNADSASKLAAGVINPVTGRRIVKTWMVDELMPFAIAAYEQLGNELGIVAIEEKSILNFFPSPQMREGFLHRQNENAPFLSLPVNQDFFKRFFNYDFGYGEITPAYLVQLGSLLPAYRQLLKKREALMEENFEYPALHQHDEGWKYKHLEAKHIVFCDGIQSSEHSFFQHLPFAPNKGEVLYIECRELPVSHIFKKGMNIVPLEADIYWVGSSYEWQFDHDKPTEKFRLQTSAWLKQWLRVPFRVIDHRSAVRPATIERRPFIGFHPLYKNAGLFNGMGTKGCTLAPFFAHQFSALAETGRPLHPEADIARFKNILSKPLKG